MERFIDFPRGALSVADADRTIDRSTDGEREPVRGACGARPRQR